MKKLIIPFLLSFFSFLFSFNIVLATSTTTPNAYDSFLEGINKVGNDSGLSKASVTEVVLSVIQILIGITGTIFLIIIVYAGIKWMFSAGDSGAIKKSISLMKNAAIGLAIVAFSYAIVDFVINNLIAITN